MLTANAGEMPAFENPRWQIRLSNTVCHPAVVNGYNDSWIDPPSAPGIVWGPFLNFLKTDILADKSSVRRVRPNERSATLGAITCVDQKAMPGVED